ncbi:hypothetical protein ACFXPX_34740 [Kitasatospora sp. NPDC059146]|uniref:hypothetical protein n=1 Tax=Kitasatospora sp. NPDC059146 TaxID=3346741 RepID=UPI0036C2C571
MSASDNVTRLARRIQKLSGLPLWRSRELAGQVKVFVKHPVPDAVTPAQRRFEAMVVSALANTFRDRQSDGAVLGVLFTTHDGDGLTLHLHPAMADEAAGQLLVGLMATHRMVGGVAGVRWSVRNGRLVIESAILPARITLLRADGAPLGVPSVLPDEFVVPAHRAEVTRANKWDHTGAPVVRDLLWSRLLRRPALLDRAALAHGVANCYTHGMSDLVIEWCCGDSVEAVFAAMLAHGLVDGLDPVGAVELYGASATAMIGGRTVILRRHALCDDGDSPDAHAADRAEALR